MRTEKYYYTEKLLEILGGAVSCYKEIMPTMYCICIWTQEYFIAHTEASFDESTAEPDRIIG